MTRLLFLPAFLLAESAAVAVSDPWMRYGLPGAMILLIVALWREDRSARIAAQATANSQYVELVSKLLETTRSNTVAMQSLCDGLQDKVSACPFDGKVMGAVLSSLESMVRRLDAIDEYLHKMRHEMVSLVAGYKMVALAEEKEHERGL